MNFSAWSIRNPVPAVLLFALLTFLGISSFRSLGIQNFPDIELPTITVAATYEGVAPAQMETEVARKIEDQVASLGGIEHITTTLTDGSASIKVAFNIDKNAEIALNEVRNALDTVRADLPAAMRDPVVSKVTTSGSAILTYAVHSERSDEEALSWFVDNDVAKAMLAVKGVGKVARIGGVDREVQVDLDSARLAALGVSAGDISTLLRQVQQDASGGRGDIGSGIQSVRTLAAVGTVAEIAALKIPLSGGRSVRLDEVAKVRDGVAERSTITLLDGQPVVSFEVTRIKGASEVAVAAAVRQAVLKLQAQHPQLQIEEAFNTVAPVQDNFDGSMELLFEGAFLAILVVWWFLRDWRATLVSAAALPLSIIPTFAAMYYFDFSLNTLTLLALALVVGILVDDAIVEIENIVRHLRMGKTPIEAATEAADEIGLAVIATTFTLVAVFLPTAFMGGVPGKFFKQFGITAAVSVLASLLVARLLTPMMAAYFLKAHGAQPADSRLMTRFLASAAWCLKHRKTTALAAILFFVGSLSLLPLLPTGFVPAADRAQTKVNIELQPGSTLEETLAVAAQARRLLEEMPEVTRVFSAVGRSSGGNDGPFAGSWRQRCAQGDPDREPRLAPRPCQTESHRSRHPQAHGRPARRPGIGRRRADRRKPQAGACRRGPRSLAPGQPGRHLRATHAQGNRQRHLRRQPAAPGNPHHARLRPRRRPRRHRRRHGRRHPHRHRRRLRRQAAQAQPRAAPDSQSASASTRTCATTSTPCASCAYRPTRVPCRWKRSPTSAWAAARRRSTASTASAT
jgi:multidrug efflux pump subunit AcrB